MTNSTIVFYFDNDVKKEFQLDGMFLGLRVSGKRPYSAMINLYSKIKYSTLSNLAELVLLSLEKRKTFDDIIINGKEHIE